MIGIKEDNYIKIPIDVVKNKKISHGAKVLYGVILYSCMGKKICKFKRREFSEMGGIIPQAILKNLKVLRQEGFIKINNCIEQGGSTCKIITLLD